MYSTEAAFGFGHSRTQATGRFQAFALKRRRDNGPVHGDVLDCVRSVCGLAPIDVALPLIKFQVFGTLPVQFGL